MMDTALVATIRDWSQRTTAALRDVAQQHPRSDPEVVDLTTTLTQAHADLARTLARHLSAERDRLANAVLEAERTVAKAEDALDAANRATDKAAETRQPRGVIARLGEIADWHQEGLGDAQERRQAAKFALEAFDEAVAHGE